MAVIRWSQANVNYLNSLSDDELADYVAKMPASSYGRQGTRYAAPDAIYRGEKILAERRQVLFDQLKNQYNNIVKLQPGAAYGGRSSDIDKIFGYQAAILDNAGVKSILDIKKDGNKVVDRRTGKTIATLSYDRDTKTTKWGDWGDVKGVANFGISFAEDGSPVFYPVYEKNKSPLSEIGLGGLEDIIVPVLTVAGIIYGVPGANNVVSAALGAAAGNSVGQLLATGDVDWDQVLKTAATAAVSAYGTTEYAATVGNAVGVTNAAAAQVVGNAIINSSLSGIEAVLTGGNVEKSMLAGAVRGAALVSATNVAEAFLGKDGIASLSKLTKLTEAQVANVFTSSLVNGITAEINNTGEFADVFGKSIVSSGVGEKAATQMDNAVKTKLKENPEIRASVFNATKNITSVATNAALSGRDVADAIDKASAGIIISSGQAYRNEVERQEELEAQRKKQLGAAQQPVRFASAEDAYDDVFEALKQVGAQPTVSETEVGREFVSTPTDAYQKIRMQGVRNDGSIYEYDTFVYWDGSIVYGFYDSNFNNVFTSERPDLRNNYTEGFTSADYANREYTAGIDFRDAIEDTGVGRAVIGGGGRPGTGDAVGFNFIGIDNDGNQKFDIGGESFTLIVLPSKEKVLVNDRTAIEFTPIIRPADPNDPDPTPVVDLKENPEPKIPPTQKPKPVELKPGEKAKGDEGVTGVTGTEGAAGGAPGAPAPAPAPSPAPAPPPTLTQKQIDDLARQAEEERQRQEMARQAEQAARLEKERLAAEGKAQEAARKAEEERVAREEAERARVAAEKLDNDVKAAQQRFDQIVSGTAPADFTVPEPQPDFDEEGYRFGQDDLSRFTEAQKTYQDLAKQVQAQIDSLNAIKGEATKTFNALDPAVQARLRSEFDNDMANLDSQINTLTTQRDEATNLATATADEIAETQAFLERIRQERESMIGRAREARTAEEQARYEREVKQFEDEARRLEEALQRAEQEGTAAAQRQVSAFQKGQRLAKEGLVVGDTRSALQREIDDLIQSEQDAARRALAAASQRESLVAPQQPGEAGREISDADIMRLLGLGPGEGERFGFQGDTEGPSAGEGPGGGVEGEGGGSADQGDGTGAGETGTGPGAGEEGLGAGGGGEGGEGGGLVETPLSPVLIFDRTGRGQTDTAPFASRVTGEALASILGEKQPLFGGDEDEQQAVWNRRSLRLLSRALGL